MATSKIYRTDALEQLDNKVDEIPGKSLLADTEIEKLSKMTGELTPEQIDEIIQEVIENIDLDSKVDKETGKGLSTNDYTDAEEEKLAGIETGANKYVHPTSHSQSEITGLETALTNKEPANSNIQTHIATQHLQFTGLAKITIGLTPPSNPQEGDLWIDTN